MPSFDGSILSVMVVRGIDWRGFDVDPSKQEFDFNRVPVDEGRGETDERWSSACVTSGVYKAEKKNKENSWFMCGRTPSPKKFFSFLIACVWCWGVVVVFLKKTIENYVVLHFKMKNFTLISIVHTFEQSPMLENLLDWPFVGRLQLNTKFDVVSILVQVSNRID